MAKDSAKMDQIRALREARLKEAQDKSRDDPATSRGGCAPKLPGKNALVSTEADSDKGKAATQRPRRIGSGSRRQGFTSGSSDVTTRESRPAHPVEPPSRDTTTYEYRDAEKRKAYMRQYMKDRRVRLRAEREKARGSSGRVKQVERLVTS